MFFKAKVWFFAAVIMLYSANAAVSETDSIKSYQTPSITVTSTHADIKSPVPYTDMNYSTIQDSYSVQDIPKLIANLPSINFYSENGNGVGYSNLSIRGFNQRRISVMINGIPQNDPEDHNSYWIDFPDLGASLDNIQVQRGAGLLNYGAAAIGGSINMTTSNYLGRKGIFISSGFGLQQYGDILVGNVNKQSIELSSGLQGNYAFYARLSRIYSDGYRNNSWADLNSYFLSATRLDDNFSTQINLFGGPINDGLSYNGIPKQYIGNTTLRRQNLSYWQYDSAGKNFLYDPAPRRKQEIEKFSQPHFEVLNEWKINDNLKMLSSLFYYQGDGFFDYDGSWADTTTLRITSKNGFNTVANPTGTIIRGAVNNKQGGWLPRIIWQQSHNAELLVGAEMRWHRSDHYAGISYAENLPTGFDPDFRIYEYKGKRDIYSIYARETISPSEGLTVNLEGQLVNHKYAISDEKSGYQKSGYYGVDGKMAGIDGDLFDINYTFFNPRIGINWDINPNHSVYSFIAVTSREPRMRNLYAADDSYFGGLPAFESKTNSGNTYFDFTKPLIKPETMLDLELGWHYYDNTFQAGVNLYWMDYSNELVNTGKLDVFGNPVDDNAKKTRHFGAEFTAAAKIFENGAGSFTLKGNLTVSSNKIIDMDWIIAYDTNHTVTKSISLKDNDIANFPSVMGYFGIEYTYRNLSLQIDNKFVGGFRTDNFGDLLTSSIDLINYLGSQSSGYYADNKLDAFSYTNLTVNYTLKNVLSLQKLKMHLHINNLFNKLYAASGEGKDFFPAAERSIYFGLELGL